MKCIYVCKTEIILTPNYHNVRYNNSNRIIIVYGQFDEHLNIYIKKLKLVALKQTLYNYIYSMA